MLRRERDRVLEPPVLQSMQHFYGGYVQRVNVGLVAWAQRCMRPGHTVHVPLQRMVAIAGRAPDCVAAVARPLADALRMNAEDVVNVTRRFAAASLRLVTDSLAETRKVRLHVEPSLLAWPTGSPLLPAPCIGEL